MAGTSMEPPPALTEVMGSCGVGVFHTGDRVVSLLPFPIDELPIVTERGMMSINTGKDVWLMELNRSLIPCMGQTLRDNKWKDVVGLMSMLEEHICQETVAESALKSQVQTVMQHDLTFMDMRFCRLVQSKVKTDAFIRFGIRSFFIAE